MERDLVREKIRALLRRRGRNMREAALATGRNASSMHQFLERDMPKVLSRQDAEKSTGLLGPASPPSYTISSARPVASGP